MNPNELAREPAQPSQIKELGLRFLVRSIDTKLCRAKQVESSGKSDRSYTLGHSSTWLFGCRRASSHFDTRSVLVLKRSPRLAWPVVGCSNEVLTGTCISLSGQRKGSVLGTLAIRGHFVLVFKVNSRHSPISN